MVLSWRYNTKYVIFVICLVSYPHNNIDNFLNLFSIWWVTCSAFKVAIHTRFSLNLLSVDDSIELTSSDEILTCLPSSFIVCSLFSLDETSTTVFSTPGVYWIVNL